MERPAKWLQPPGIIDWLEKEFKNSIKINFRRNVSHNYDDNTSNRKNFICLIQLSQLPENWINRSVKNIPLEYRQQIFDFLFKCLERDLKFD